MKHMRAYRIYVTYTLTIRTNMLDIRLMRIGTLLIRHEYATHTFVKACSRDSRLKVVQLVRIRRFFLKFANAFYHLHTQFIHYSVTAPIYCHTHVKNKKKQAFDSIAGNTVVPYRSLKKFFIYHKLLFIVIYNSTFR